MNKKAEKFLLSVVRSGYENIAESFNETRKKPMKETIYKIVADLKILPNNKILDLGCGNGRFIELLKNNTNYLGLDNSPRLIEFARGEYGQKFKVFNILNIKDLEEKNFDFIFSWAVFHHIPGNNLRIGFLQEVYEKLNNNGFFVFSVWKLRQKNNFFKLFVFSFLKNLLKGRVIDFGDLIFSWHGNKNKQKSLRYYHAFSNNELRSLVKKTKFKIEEFLEDDFNYYLILKK